MTGGAWTNSRSPQGVTPTPKRMAIIKPTSSGGVNTVQQRHKDDSFDMRACEPVTTKVPAGLIHASRLQRACASQYTAFDDRCRCDRFFRNTVSTNLCSLRDGEVCRNGYKLDTRYIPYAYISISHIVISKSGNLP